MQIECFSPVQKEYFLPPSCFEVVFGLHVNVRLENAIFCRVLSVFIFPTGADRIFSDEWLKGMLLLAFLGFFLNLDSKVVVCRNGATTSNKWSFAKLAPPRRRSFDFA